VDVGRLSGNPAIPRVFPIGREFSIQTLVKKRTNHSSLETQFFDQGLDAKLPANWENPWYGGVTRQAAPRPRDLPRCKHDFHVNRLFLGKVSANQLLY